MKPFTARMLVGLASLFTPVIATAQTTAVEPEALTKRADLLGKEVELDDRVGRFQFHPNGGFDELYLKRAPDVTFALPERLRPPHNPSMPAVKVRGVLKKDNGRYLCEVTALDPLPADLDRLNRGVALLAKSDTENRMSWVRWAESRVKAFRGAHPKDSDPVDEALLARAREIESEVIRMEADRPARDPAAHWLMLAEKARSREIPEPEPSALAQRGFRASLVAARSANELKKLRDRIEAFFPSAKDSPKSSVDLSAWENPYKTAPADAYRLAKEDVRTAMNHKLWADAVQFWLERRATDDPKSLIPLAEESSRLLPDRPYLTSTLLEKGLEVASRDVGSLRQREVESLAKLYGEKLNQPGKARELYRAWLDDQRNRLLSPRDLEGRLTLAEQYETLLDDKVTAVALIRDAWKIDPQSKDVSAAFRQRGFRKVGEEWVAKSETGGNEREAKAVEKGRSFAAADRGNVGEPGEPPPAPKEREGDAAVLATNSLRGATQEQVRGRLSGAPNRRIYSASQGQVVEQWIFYQPGHTVYINFRRKPGESTPRVVAHYTLRRSASEFTPAPP